MTDLELEIYHMASRAAVADSRPQLARALRFARRHVRHFPQTHSQRFGAVPLTTLCRWQANYIGWPVRVRPNGRYL